MVNEDVRVRLKQYAVIGAQASFGESGEEGLQQYLLRQAVLAFVDNSSAAMDYPKVYDSELDHLNHISILSFLALKKTPALTRKLFTDSVDTDIADDPERTLLPHYSFIITGYQIGQHVEYAVTLIEKYRILKRTIAKHITFKTRYSLLEALDEKMGGMGLPAKRWFGNRSKEFVERRRVELQEYLNRVGKSKKPAFYRFVAQIRDSAFNSSLNQPFSIE